MVSELIGMYRSDWIHLYSPINHYIEQHMMSREELARHTSLSTILCCILQVIVPYRSMLFS